MQDKFKIVEETMIPKAKLFAASVKREKRKVKPYDCYS